MDLVQDWPAPSRPLPIVVIGAGSILRDAHLPAYRKAGLTVAAVTDLDRARATALAGDWAIGAVHDIVAAHGTGVVYDVAVPPGAMLPVLAALPEGAAVLIQKPMGTDLAMARAIGDLRRAKDLTAAINFQLRFLPMMLAKRQMILSCLLGDLLEVGVHLNIYTLWDLFPFLIPMPRVEIAVDSIHYLDAIRALAGTPKGVFARTLRDPRQPDFAQTRASIILDCDAPLRGLVSINHNHQGGRKIQSAWLWLGGTRGFAMVKLGVCFDYPRAEPDELWYCPAGGDWGRIPLSGSCFIDSFMGPMRNLQRMVSGEDTALFTGTEDAFHTRALVEASYRSAASQAEPLAPA